MEQKSLWKNFLLLTVSGLLALHLNVASAADNSSTDESQEESESCLEIENE